MAFETGGRADKLGNIFEYKWTVLNLLDVLFEKIEYVTIEAIGADERGVDLWIGNKDGTREGQQCKARNASNEKWDYNSIKARGVINKWKMQLERHENNRVSLVSPLAFTLLEDLIYRANTSINPKDFLEYQINASGSKTKKLFQNICNDFGLNPHAKDSDLIKIINYLSRISYRQAPNSELKNSEVIKIIKPLLPKNNTDIKYSNWENRYMHTDSPERACIKVLKSANKNFVKDNPDEFINTYRPFFSQGNILYNEIILDAFMYFPASEKYADFIITYLYDDFDMTLLEGTSGNENRLEMAKRVIGKYSVYCSDSVYNTLEYKINIYSNVERMRRIYKNRIDYYKENGIHVFWRFWGDLQKELLPILPPNRKSHKVKDLERVLNRKIKDNNTIYFLSSPQFGSTITSITNKCLSFNNWKSIFKSTKLKNNNRWREIGTNIIENNIKSFSNVFYETVSKNTIKMIKFMLELDFDVDELYIDALYKGISYSNTLDDIDTDLIEKVFKKYPCDNNNSSRALEFCEIILKKKNASWSMVTLETLKNLAQNHIDPQPDTAAASNAITCSSISGFVELAYL